MMLRIDRFKLKPALRISNRKWSNARQYQLDGVDETICLVIADIRHQGRAKSPVIVSALQSPNPLNALLNIGEPKYRERLAVLRREIKALSNEGIFGSYKYDLAKGDFVRKI